MQNTLQRFIFSIISAAQVVSLFLLMYTVFTVLLHNFNLLDTLTDRLILRYIYLRMTITLFLLLGFIGWYLASKYTDLGKIKAYVPALKHRLLYIIIGLFLAAFYIDPVPKENFLLFSIIYLVLVLTFYILIPRLIYFYANWNFIGLSYWKSVVKHDEYKISKKEYVLLFSSVFIVCIGFWIILSTSARYIQGEITRENLIRQSTFITEVVPIKTTNAERVSLIGYNLGWKTNEDKRYGLYIGKERIEQVELWQDTVITFTLPLHIEPGLKKVWITRPKDMLQEKSPRIKSNMMDIEVIPRLSYMPSEFDSTETKVWKKINAKFQSFKNSIKRILYEK